MSYRSRLQAEALKLVAKKLQSSLAVEGELPEDGLAALADDGEDLMMALARRIVSGEEDGAETVEEVFAQARDAVSEAEELLVDVDWRPVEVEPEAVGVNGNGNGHGSDIFGPTVELVPVPVNGNGANGHHDEETEPQQSLFSWAEFMDEEQSRPKGRRRRPQPASMSMFEWAFEQEREAELACAGS